MKVYDFYIQNFGTLDKTKLIALIMSMKRIAICLAISFYTMSLGQMLLIGYWGLLIYCTETGKNIIDFIIDKVLAIADFLNQIVADTTNVYALFPQLK